MWQHHMAATPSAQGCLAFFFFLSKRIIAQLFLLFADDIFSVLSDCLLTFAELTYLLMCLIAS